MNRTNIPFIPFIPINVHSLGETGSYLMDIVLNQHSSASELFLIALAFGVFWFVTFYIIKSIIRPFVHNKPWLRVAMERDYERSAKKMLLDLQIKMTKVSRSKFSGMVSNHPIDFGPIDSLCGTNLM